MTRLVLATFMALLVVGCEQAIMSPVPSSDNTAVFNEYMDVVATKYGMLAEKGVDARLLADSLRPFVTNDMSDSAFLSILQVVVDRLQEGHTSVVRDDSTGVYYTWYLTAQPGVNIGTVLTHYSSSDLNPDYTEIGVTGFFSISYHRLLQDTTIGYIRIPSFSIDVTNEEIESMLRDLSSTRGLIIDVRSNLGGFIDVAYRLASYFTATATVVGVDHMKTGPGAGEFVASTITLSPSSSTVRYTKPIYVLTDRITFSSGSLFSNAMSVQSHATTLGLKNGGGCGAITTGILGNGWRWTMPTSHFVDYKGISTHDGQIPEVEMPYNASDTEHDTYIDEALRRLSP